MRRGFAVVLAAVLLLAAGTAWAAETYGAGVTLEQTTPIRDIMARPAEFEGRTVRIEAVVTAVCEHMGCWMALAPAEAPAGSTLLLKVDDGVIVFPVSAKGKRVVAQGVVQRVGGDAEGQSAAAEHAKAAGGASAGDRAPASWQIKATGAVID